MLEVDFGVVGVDEAGRGPIFGPVVAAAVFFEKPVVLDGVRDSKALSPRTRERVFEEIQEFARFSVGIASPEEIDLLNIFHATELAMNRALEGLADVTSACKVLVDGKNLKLRFPSECVVGGDRRVYQIAAASVVAKVFRDRLVADLDKLYPGYFLSSNKGYPTKKHVEALSMLGPTPFHRLTFGPVLAHLSLERLDKWRSEGLVSESRYFAVVQRLDTGLFGDRRFGGRKIVARVR